MLKIVAPPAWHSPRMCMRVGRPRLPNFHHRKVAVGGRAVGQAPQVRSAPIARGLYWRRGPRDIGELPQNHISVLNPRYHAFGCCLPSNSSPWPASIRLDFAARLRGVLRCVASARSKVVYVRSGTLDTKYAGSPTLTYKDLWLFLWSLESGGFIVGSRRKSPPPRARVARKSDPPFATVGRGLAGRGT